MLFNHTHKKKNKPLEYVTVALWEVIGVLLKLFLLLSPVTIPLTHPHCTPGFQSFPKYEGNLWRLLKMQF
jgi:hypothetical protein